MDSNYVINLLVTGLEINTSGRGRAARKNWQEVIGKIIVIRAGFSTGYRI